MRKTILGILVVCGLLGIGLAGIAMANSAVDSDEPAMMVSPSMIVLAKVDAVTVHTNIVASSVESGSIDLDGAAPIGVGVDSCGDIVLKFAVADLDLEPGLVTLTLSGDLKDGSSFSATDVVSVK
ncbi:MAG: hypothetical protein JSV65_01915 [Armatimonadota bacterium]|nr:MAG: hypothetical protein JSV65_01915 [Armatimonadota bacterium]